MNHVDLTNRGASKKLLPGIGSASLYGLTCLLCVIVGSSCTPASRSTPSEPEPDIEGALRNEAREVEPAGGEDPVSLITDLDVAPSGELWASVAQPAALKRSADGGKTWSSALSTGGSGFADLTFLGPDGKRAVLIGQDGEVWRSVDGGDEWRPVDVRLGESMHGAAWTDDGLGLAVGIDAVIRRSTDAGASWSSVSTDHQETLRDVVFAGARRAWAVGNRGLVLYSADGGLTWERQDSGTRDTLFAVAFADETHGWCVGRAGVVVATTDGGATWNRMPSGVDTTLFAIGAIDRMNVLVAGDRGIVRRSGDGGKTWSTAGPVSSTQWRALEAQRDGRLFLGGYGETIVSTRWR